MEKEMESISNKGIAVVTGASSGIGAVYADRLAGRGYDLKLVARRGDRLEALTQRLRSEYGVAVEYVVADLANQADLERVAQILENDPNVSILVNNAGTGAFSPFADASTADSVNTVAVNITALTRLTHAVIPAFKARDSGTLINIGSVLGYHSLSYSSVYSGTKGFVVNFTRGLQEEFAGTKVRIQLVHPAATATEIWDIAGVPLTQLDPSTVMTTEDLVDAALAGLDQGELVTIPPLEDYEAWEAFDQARIAMFAGTRTGRPASRYAAVGTLV